MTISAWAPIVKTKQNRRMFNNVVRYWDWDDGMLIRFRVRGERGYGYAWIGPEYVVVRWQSRNVRQEHGGSPSIEAVERIIASK